jgi:hypothetical protein
VGGVNNTAKPRWIAGLTSSAYKPLGFDGYSQKWVFQKEICWQAAGRYLDRPAILLSEEAAGKNEIFLF